jgi:hypothetical protein
MMSLWNANLSWGGREGEGKSLFLLACEECINQPILPGNNNAFSELLLPSLQACNINAFRKERKINFLLMSGELL